MFAQDVFVKYLTSHFFVENNEIMLFIVYSDKVNKAQ